MRVLFLLCVLCLVTGFAGCSGARSAAGSVPAAAAAGSGGDDSQRRSDDDTSSDETRAGTVVKDDPYTRDAVG